MTTLAYRRTAPNDKPIKWRKVRRRRVVRMGELDWFALLLLASIVLLFDALVIGRHVGIIRLPGELSVLDMARLGAMNYVDIQRTMLQRDEFAGVGSADPVLRGAAEGLIGARSTEEIGRELAEASAQLYEAVQADRLNAARGRVLELLSHSQESSFAFRNRLDESRSLCTYCCSERGIFYIAASINPPAIGENCRSDSKAGIRDISVLARTTCCLYKHVLNIGSLSVCHIYDCDILRQLHPPPSSLYTELILTAVPVGTICTHVVPGHS
jgi:hypothetical protein